MYCYLILYTIRKHPLIHRRANTKYAVGNNPGDEQPDERFPECDAENTSDDERDDDSRSDIHYRYIKDTVGVSTFSRTTKYIFVTA